MSRLDEAVKKDQLTQDRSRKLTQSEKKKKNIAEGTNGTNRD